MKKKPKKLTRGPTGENIHSQSVASEEWFRRENSKLPDLVQEIEALGGCVSMVHDEILVEFHKDTPTENQEKILALLHNHTSPKFENCKLELPQVDLGWVADEDT